MHSRLLLLGHFTLRREGEQPQTIAISSKKARGLIAFLAMQPSRTADRQEIATLLWGDRSDRNARQALRQCLSMLRAGLGAAGADVIRPDGDEISLSNESLSVDASEFLSAVDAADAARLERAVSLYRGPFLAGLDVGSEPFEQWLREQRLRIETVAARLLETHARQMDASSHGMQALAAVDRLIAIDPLREDWQRLGLEISARHQGRDAALARAKTFTAMLTRELGVAAQPATVAMIEEIKGGGIAPRADGTVIAPYIASTRPLETPTLAQTGIHIASAMPVEAERAQLPPPSSVADTALGRIRWAAIKDYSRRYGLIIGFFGAIGIDSVLDAGLGPWYEKVFGEAKPGQASAEVSSQSRVSRPLEVASTGSATMAKTLQLRRLEQVPLLVIASREEGSANRYVTDAFTDELSDSLARLPKIKVLSRQTAHLFLTKSGDVTRLGFEFGVRYVVETSLQPRASSTLINVDLIDVADGRIVWSKRTEAANATFTKDRNDISQALAATIRSQLTAALQGTPPAVNATTAVAPH